MAKVAIGFIMETLGNDQLSKAVIQILNHYSKNDLGVDFIVYIDYPSPCELVPLFGVMNSTGVLGHNGPLVTFSIKYMPILLESFKEKYFYILGAEYEQFKLDPKFLKQVFNNKDIKLIAISEDIAKKLKKDFGSKIHNIVSNLDCIQQIKEECKDHKQAYSLDLA